MLRKVFSFPELGPFEGKYYMRKYLEEEFYSFRVPFLTVIIRL